ADDDLDDEDLPADDEEVPDDDEEDEEVAPAPKKRDEDDDEDEEAPDDVEADLDTILKDRIAASDDEGEDEEELDGPAGRPGTAEAVDGVQPKKANEFVCPGCFLLVNPGQFGPVDSMECPVGESVCPAIDRLQKQARKARK